MFEVVSTSHELAKLLLSMPDLEVTHVWDGMPRTSIKYVWESKDGKTIVTADEFESIFETSDTPRGFGDYWHTGKVR